MEEKIFFQSDAKLCGIITRPENPNGRAVVLCHGITVGKEESGIFTRLALSVSAQGYTVLRFDFRGIGESELSQEEVTLSGEVRDVVAAVDYMQSQGFEKVILLGASFGGGIVTLYTGQYPQNVSLLLLWNPCLNYDHSFFKPTLATRKWVSNLFIGENKKLLDEKGYVLLGSREFHMGKKLLDEMRKTKPYESLKKISAPTIIFHGTKDSKVDFHDSIEYVQNPKGFAKLYLYKNFEHGFHRSDEYEQVSNDTLHSLVRKYG